MKIILAIVTFLVLFWFTKIIINGEDDSWVTHSLFILLLFLCMGFVLCGLRFIWNLITKELKR